MSKSAVLTPPRRVSVGIATTGRAEVLCQTVKNLAHQTVQPTRIIISAISEDDIRGVELENVPVELITNGRGLTQQRNRILDQAAEDEIIVFFDDDFVPCADYLEQVLALFSRHSDVVLMTGAVLADGILGQGIRFEDAVAQVAAAGPPPSEAVTDVYGVYGCNFAVFSPALHKERIRLDENLPLYSWLEDVDFSRALAPYGRIVKAQAARGVHMGVKSGRTSGVRFGYSQMVNPAYLIRKGTMKPSMGIRLATRNLLANIAKSFRPEPYIDRAGRLRGNLRGLAELLLGRAHPSKITDF